MTNFEKYNKLHSEVMSRLENGEITIETAKEVNDLAFEKYIEESSGTNGAGAKFATARINTLTKDLLALAKKYKVDSGLDADSDYRDIRKAIKPIYDNMTDSDKVAYENLLAPIYNLKDTVKGSSKYFGRHAAKNIAQGVDRNHPHVDGNIYLGKKAADRSKDLVEGNNKSSNHGFLVPNSGLSSYDGSEKYDGKNEPKNNKNNIHDKINERNDKK